MKFNNTKMLSFDDVLLRPQPGNIHSRSKVQLECNYYNNENKLIYSGLPVIVANLSTTGTIPMAQRLFKDGINVCLHKYHKLKDLLTFFEEDYSNLAWPTIGLEDTYFDDLKRSHKHITKLCLDVANGYLDKVTDKIKELKDNYPDVILMVGNVCTPEGCLPLINANADILKLGIGNGSACLTSNKSGVGNLQFSVILECIDCINSYGKLMCSDGSIKSPSDICKAIAAGSHVVACGGLFAGYKENDATFFYEDGKKVMRFYGMSSKLANDKYNGGLKEYRTSEGKELLIPFKGDISELVQDIKGGLASCCTYLNFKKLQDMVGKGEFYCIK